MDRQLNPTTGDYTADTIATLANAVYIRLFTPLGSWWADPSLGSRLHELARQKDLTRVRVLARQYAEDALAPLTRDGRAQRVAVEALSPVRDQSGAGRCLLLIEVEDATGGTASYSYHVKV
jgi:phage gp46-like protein